MANPKRVMARMVKVGPVSPIEGADRIEQASVGGWTVVIGKGDFSEGDLAVFFEVNSFLPSDDSRYEGFDGHKEMLVNGGMKKGHVLRTARLRGVWSQGLLMDPHDVLPSSIPEYAYEQMYERKTNLSNLCGVCEYEPVRPTQGDIGMLGRYDPWCAPRTEAERVQNVSQEAYDAMKKADHFISVKVDGTSMTCLFDPRYDRIRLFSHNNEISIDKGFGQQVYDKAAEQGIIGWVTDNPGKTVQFEACGPKINGNRLGLKEMRLYVFSVWDTDKCEYIDMQRMLQYGNEPVLSKSFAPIVLDLNLYGHQKTTDLIEWVDGLRGRVTDRLDEGIVIHAYGRGRTTEEEWRLLQSELGATMQIKAISRKYLLKAKE